MFLLSSGLGVTVCDRLQCVCDRTTAECMAASHFNHSVTSRCSGPRPPCVHRPHPPAQPTDADSSQESSENASSDLETQGKSGYTKPSGGAREQEGKDAGKPAAEEDKEDEDEGNEEEEDEGKEQEEGEDDEI